MVRLGLCNQIDQVVTDFEELDISQYLNTIETFAKYL